MATVSGGTISPVTGKIVGDDITNPARHDNGGRKPVTWFAPDSTQEAVYGPWIVPLNYANTPVLELKVAGRDANTTKTVDTEVKVQATSDGDSLTADGWDTLNEITNGSAIPDAAGEQVTIPHPLANNDNLAPGDVVYFHVQRDHDDADDDASGDMGLYAAEVKYNDA